jgi:diguanylate cyclase (GGDEF)-like protein
MGNERHTGQGRPPARHFTGMASRLVIEFLTDELGSAAVLQVLRRAGESRTVEELSNDSTWSSYDQFRALLEQAAVATGGPQQLRRIAHVGLRPVEMSGKATAREGALHALGSPDAVYASVVEMNHMIWTVALSEVEQVGPREWVSSTRMKDGFEAFPELCALMAGLIAVPPTVFGMPLADVAEEACQCDGAPACQLRIRWHPSEDEASRSGYLERRIQVLENRLGALQHTVIDLVSGADLEEVLSGIVASAAKAVAAPSYVLAIEALPAADRLVYSVGLDEETAAARARQILIHGLADDRNVLVAEVATPRRRYGRLAAIRDGVGFLEPERIILAAYASLAAAAIEFAASLDDSRQQAATAHALLELSASMAELASTDEMALRVARAIPLVIDCDHAIVALADPGSRTARVAAAFGLPAPTEALLQQTSFAVDAAVKTEFVCHDTTTAPIDSTFRKFMVETRSVAAASVPIVTNGELIGWVAVGVTERPERLATSEDLAERLRGLAGQAANAISNARLLDRVQHQALHDDMTGLPNRMLILDRTERMLARGRREHLHIAALFIDLDNFKDINDTLGHAAGDQLLQAFAARIGSALRTSDSVGRLGGDEFIVLTEAASEGVGAEVVAQRIREVLREPFAIAATPGMALTMTASIGIADGDRPSALELLRDADIALYRAKAEGKDCWAKFEPGMSFDGINQLEAKWDSSARFAAPGCQ